MRISRIARGKGVLLWLMACCLSIGAMPLARAALTENIAVDPTAMSLGNAVTADPPGISSIHFNPAGLARIKGNTHTNILLAASIRTRETYNSAPDMNIGGFKDDPLNGTSSGPVRNRLYVPVIGLLPWHLPLMIGGNAEMGFSWNAPGSRFTFGSNVYLSMGMSVDRSKDPNDPSRFAGKLVQIERINYLSPSIGYEVSDTLRVGASVPIAWQVVVLNSDLRMPNKLLGTIGSLQKGMCPGGNPTIVDTLTFGMCGGGPEGMLNPFNRVANLNVDMVSNFDPTINLGVLWEPKSWFGLGLVYQGGSKTVYHGTYSFRVDPMMRQFVAGINSSLLGPIIAGIAGMPIQIPAVQNGNLSAIIPFPSRWQAGIKIKPIDKLQFNMDVGYSNWAQWNQTTLQFDQNIALMQMARIFGIADSSKMTMQTGLRSVVNYGFGMQAQVTPKLALRLGYEPRKSSVPLNQLSVMTSPLPDTTVKSVGLQYKLSDGGQINVGYSFMRGTYDIPARSDCNLNCDHFFNIVYNPYAASDVSGSIVLRYFGVSIMHPF